MSPLHVRARAGDVAAIVLLPGDPGRARKVAEKLEGAKCYNEHRGLLGFTGRYQGVPVSVQTTGMGSPAAAIVSEELIQLGARVLLRIGTCGSIGRGIAPADLVIATASCPLEGTSRLYLHGDPHAPAASFRVVRAAAGAAKRLGAAHHVGLIATEDAFYADDENHAEKWARRGVLAFEMEASALFTVCALRGVEAGCLLTVSNASKDTKFISDADLAAGVERMVQVVLETAKALV